MMDVDVDDRRGRGLRYGDRNSEGVNHHHSDEVRSQALIVPNIGN